MPDQMKPFQIECDASKYATGAVLTQCNINGARHPVLFHSKSFSETEWNYEIYDHKLLAMIRALEEWRHLIQGGQHTTTIYSDHKNLTYWKEPQKLNRRQAQWTQTLSEYDIELIHKPGNQMLIADLLSRRANHIPKEDNDNEDITVLPQKLFVNLVDIDLQNKIAKSRSYDADATSTIEILKKQGPTTLQKNLQEWTTEEYEGNTIFFFKGKAYIPKDEEL
jgi:hypothetical protein